VLVSFNIWSRVTRASRYLESPMEEIEQMRTKQFSIEDIIRSKAENNDGSNMFHDILEDILNNEDSDFVQQEAKDEIILHSLDVNAILHEEDDIDSEEGGATGRRQSRTSRMLNVPTGKGFGRTSALFVPVQVVNKRNSSVRKSVDELEEEKEVETKEFEVNEFASFCIY
jgi:hypothetical protein